MCERAAVGTSEVIGLLTERPAAAAKEMMVHILEISSSNMGFISKKCTVAH